MSNKDIQNGQMTNSKKKLQLYTKILMISNKVRILNSNLIPLYIAGRFMVFGTLELLERYKIEGNKSDINHIIGYHISPCVMDFGNDMRVEAT